MSLSKQILMEAGVFRPASKNASAEAQEGEE